MAKELEKITCTSCGKEAARSSFYTSKSNLYKHYGYITICKSCVYELYDSYLKQNEGNTRTAVYFTCRKIDIQFSDKDYESAVTEQSKSNKHLFGLYMTKHKSLGKFNSGETGDTFDTSDSLTLESQTLKQDKVTTFSINEDSEEFKLTENDEKIKQDVIRLMGYDPFSGYSLYDQKFLYGDLIGYLDEDTLDDNYKLMKIIQLIINDHQIRKYDFMISKISGDLEELKNNSDAIKSLTSLKKNITDMSDKIAKENSISVKNRGDKKAGSNTLGYMMKYYRELGFKEAEEDYYNQLRAYGMRQCADISNQSIVDILNFDEKDIDDLIKLQRETIQKLQMENDDLIEKIRVLTEESKNK